MGNLPGIEEFSYSGSKDGSEINVPDRFGDNYIKGNVN